MYFATYIVEIIFLYYLSRALHKRLFSLVNRIFKKEKIATWVIAIIFLPGTLIHEIAHYLTALFLFIPVDNINLLPRHEKKKIKLGSVKMKSVDPFRSFIVSVAPFIFGNLIIFFSVSYFIQIRFNVNIFWIVLGLYLLIVIANTMFLSRSDFAGVWKLLLIVAIIFLLLYLCGIRNPLSIFPESIARINPLFKNVAIILSFPILIDVIINAILGLVVKGGERE